MLLLVQFFMEIPVIFVGALLNILGDILLKSWADGKIGIAWGLCTYTLDAAVFAYLLNTTTRFTSYLIVWELIVVLVGASYGYLVLGERYSTQNVIGMIMAMASIYLIER